MRSDRGFTLMELLVSLALASLVLTMLTLALRNTLHTWESAKSRQAEVYGGIQPLDYPLGRWLEGAVILDELPLVAGDAASFEALIIAPESMQTSRLAMLRLAVDGDSLVLQLIDDEQSHPGIDVRWGGIGEPLWLQYEMDLQGRGLTTYEHEASRTGLMAVLICHDRECARYTRLPVRANVDQRCTVDLLSLRCRRRS